MQANTPSAMLEPKHIVHPPLLPPRSKFGNKGTFGRVLIVGGSEGMIGAPALAGLAAFRMGAGLVQIAVPQAILSSVLSITPEMIGLGLENEFTGRLMEAAEKADAIVLGPGLGQSAQAEKRVLHLIESDKPMVVDADALNLLSKLKTWPASFKASAVLTPHPGEMARLGRMFGDTKVHSSPEGRIGLALQAAQAFGQVIVLKGEHTVVTDGRQVFLNQTGDSSLAKAGTGDVLSGMIGSLLAQKMGGFEAACLGAHLHGLAGEIAGRKLGMRSVLAHEVAGEIPQAIRDYEHLSLPSFLSEK